MKTAVLVLQLVTFVVIVAVRPRLLELLGGQDESRRRAQRPAHREEDPPHMPACP